MNYKIIIVKYFNIFNNFKKNTNTYSERLNIIKNTSLNFFTINKKNFDFIYVDGSHEYVDVKKDADEAFKIIEKRWNNNF